MHALLRSIGDIFEHQYHLNEICRLRRGGKSMLKIIDVFVFVVVISLSFVSNSDMIFVFIFELKLYLRQCMY